MLLAHRPGFVAPTLAARKLATLDRFSGGRVAVHVISGGSDADQRRDGDYLDHDARYRRTDEYLEVLRALWTAEGPVDHAGEFYRFEGASPAVRPPAAVPADLLRRLLGRGDRGRGAARRRLRALGRAARRGARAHRARAGGRGGERTHAPLQPLAAGHPRADRGGRVGASAALLAQVRANAGRQGHTTAARSESVGSQRLLEAAAAGDVHDTRLYTAIAEATGARGNTTALVGTAEQVAESLLAYVDIGVTTLLLRGFDPLEDAREYAGVVSFVRAEVAHRDAMTIDR